MTASERCKITRERQQCQRLLTQLIRQSPTFETQLLDLRWRSARLNGRKRRFVRPTTQNRDDISIRRCCFSDEEAQRFRSVFKEPFAKRSLTVDKTPDGPLVYTEAPRGCRDTAKNLDAMGEVFLRLLHGDCPDHFSFIRSCTRHRLNVASWPAAR
jgi:hypothetical protein